jgi:antibiotic biosynthesis monooxygenase (ABM) superfamily enzyme
VEVRVSRASAVIVQHVPAAAVDRFLEWQRSVARVAEGFAGYRGADIYPPPGGQGGDWVAVIHFDDQQALRAWLDSPIREEWVRKIRAEMGEARLTTLPGGFAAWFAGQGGSGQQPPGWKIALTVLLGLYPTVMVLTLFFPGPYLKTLGPAVAMLIGNALSVSFLQWVVTPALNPLLGRWLAADPRRERAVWVGGLVLILLSLAALVLLFRQVGG